MPRVLVVDDDVWISALISDVLEMHGFEVDTAENGAVALTKVCASAPNMIVLDLMMPVMDGWEFLRRCRDLPDCVDTKILVVSAMADPQLELLGAVQFLGKPFDMNELLEALTRLATQP
jgi:CheY-like chemotaxis protein